MLVESSMEPSPEYLSLRGQRSGPPADVHGLEPGKKLRFGDIADNGVNGESRNLCGRLRFRYWWFNSSEPFGTVSSTPVDSPACCPRHAPLTPATLNAEL